MQVEHAVGRLRAPVANGVEQDAVLRVGDVARVEMVAQNEDTETRINGQPSVGVALYLAPDANAVATAAAVDRTLKRLSARFPEDLRARVVYDSTVFVEDTIREVLVTVGERGWLEGERVVELTNQIRAEHRDLTLKIFRAGDTAAAQGHADNPTLANEFIFDWIASRLREVEPEQV